MLSDAALDENDIRIYDEFVDRHGADFMNEWDNDFNQDLDFEYPIQDDLGAIVQDLNIKFSPESSDSGNYSPKSDNSHVGSECFNSSDSWNTFSPYGNPSGYIDESVNLSTFQQPKISNASNNFKQFTPKLTPVNVTHVNSPTYYTATLPTSSANMVMARPVETITLVPAKMIAPNGQTFVVSSAPPLKLAPIQKSVIQNQPPSATSCNQEEDNPADEYRKKMEDRRLRNRAAAQASRHRKRLQMDIMKEKLDEYEAECMNLRLENENLRKRVTELEKENEILLSTQNNNTPKHKKARTVGVCLAMCALVFTFSGSFPSRNTSHTTDLQLSNAITVQNSPEYTFLRRHGRSLAEVPDYEAIPDPPQEIVDNKTIKVCPPSFLNASEKIRLNNDLNAWINRHEQMNFVELRQGIKPFLIHNSPKHKPRVASPQELSNSTGILKLTTEDRKNIRLSKRNMREKARKPDKTARPIRIADLNRAVNHAGNYELAVRSEVESRLMDQLASAIKQEDDVLYVVTMKDYFLMPMIHRNATNSPKISIVIPALNSSNPNQIQMLQIDCIVSSTRNFYLSDSLASLFNRSGQN